MNNSNEMILEMIHPSSADLQMSGHSPRSETSSSRFTFDSGSVRHLMCWLNGGERVSIIEGCHDLADWQKAAPCHVTESRNRTLIFPGKCSGG